LLKNHKYVKELEGERDRIKDLNESETLLKEKMISENSSNELEIRKLRAQVSMTLKLYLFLV
jgi:hypothetical protein